MACIRQGQVMAHHLDPPGSFGSMSGSGCSLSANSASARCNIAANTRGSRTSLNVQISVFCYEVDMTTIPVLLENSSDFLRPVSPEVTANYPA